MNDDISNPRCQKVYDAALLRTIAHAFWLLNHPEFDHEYSWDDNNYNMQDSAGTRGTITFNGNFLVAAFFAESSPISPFRLESIYDIDDFLKDVPKDIKDLAKKETLRYLLEEYDGKIQPIITSFFWCYGNGIVICEHDWSDVVSNGAYIIAQDMGEIKQVLDIFAENYGFSEKQLSIIESVFKMRISDLESNLVLERQDILAFLGDDRFGLDQSRALFGDVKIAFPDDL